MMNYPAWNETGISKRFIHELQRYCLENDQIDKIVLYGSRAREDYRRTSNMDLAIFTKDCFHTEQNIIEQAIYELPTPLKMDIVFMDRLTLISNINKEGVVIYQQGKTHREAE